MGIIRMRIKAGYDSWLRTQVVSASRYDGEIVSITGFTLDDNYVYIRLDSNCYTSVPARFIELVTMDDDGVITKLEQPFALLGK